MYWLKTFQHFFFKLEIKGFFFLISAIVLIFLFNSLDFDLSENSMPRNTYFLTPANFNNCRFLDFGK